MKRYVIIDVETGGLNPYKHPLIEIAVLDLNADAPTVIEIEPLPELTFHSEAEKMHADREWKNRVPLYRGLLQLKSLLASDELTLIGHNVGFDVRFIDVNIRRAGINWDIDFYRTIDTASIARMLEMTGRLKGASLRRLAAHFGVKHDNAHTAAGDVIATREVFLGLMSMLKP